MPKFNQASGARFQNIVSDARQVPARCNVSKSSVRRKDTGPNSTVGMNPNVFLGHILTQDFKIMHLTSFSVTMRQTCRTSPAMYRSVIGCRFL